jgi:hypothetical protein
LLSSEDRRTDFCSVGFLADGLRRLGWLPSLGRCPLICDGRGIKVRRLRWLTVLGGLGLLWLGPLRRRAILVCRGLRTKVGCIRFLAVSGWLIRLGLIRRRRLLLPGVKYLVILLAVTCLGWDTIRLAAAVACRGSAVGRLIWRDRGVAIVRTIDTHGAS